MRALFAKNKVRFACVNWTACADFSTGVARWRGPLSTKTARKPSPTFTAVTPSPPAATQWSLLLRAAYGLQRTPRLTMHFSGYDSAVFLVPGDLDLSPSIPKFEFGRDFCTVHLTAKFHHPTFNRSEVIVRTNKLTNKQTDAAESIHLAPLCYAGGQTTVMCLRGLV